MLCQLKPESWFLKIIHNLKEWGSNLSNVKTKQKNVFQFSEFLCSCCCFFFPFQHSCVWCVWSLFLLSVCIDLRVYYAIDASAYRLVISGCVSLIPTCANVPFQIACNGLLTSFHVCFCFWFWRIFSWLGPLHYLESQWLIYVKALAFMPCHARESITEYLMSNTGIERESCIRKSEH